MRLIDADELMKKAKDIVVGEYRHRCIDPYDVDHAPSIDAVPVIRCKDCKYRYIKNDVVWTCPFGLPSGPDGYCSWAERKEE